MVWKRTAAAPAASSPASAAGAPPPPSATPQPAATPAAAAAGLPPVTPPAPNNPPSPAAESKPSRSRRSVPAQAASAATVAPAATAAPSSAVASPHPQLPGVLSILTPKNAGPSVLNAIVDGRTSAGVPNVFPKVYLTGGDTGGQMQFHDMNPEGSNAELPTGVDPVHCILLAVRLELLLWPKAYQRGVKMTPKSRAIVSFDDFEAADVVQKAAQRYAFRNRSNSDQYDPFGHPTISLEMLVYDPQAGLYGLESGSTYDSVFNTAKELAVAFPQVTPTPVLIAPQSYTTAGSKSQPGWLEHYYKITQAANAPEMKDIIAGFNGFLQQTANDQELAAALTEWQKQTLTEEQFNACKAISELR